MMPLPRWVFLAALLGHAMIVPVHPYEDACVRVCHANVGYAEVTGGCEYENLVRQSDGSQAGTRGLFRLCLTPCDNLRDRKDHPISETLICRLLREMIIADQRCDCESIIDEYDDRRLPGLDPKKGLSELLLEKLVARFAKSKGNLDYLANRLISFLIRSGTFSLEEVKAAEPTGLPEVDNMMEAVLLRLEELQVGGRKGSGENTVDNPDSPKSSEEDEVDWEMWCMAQCDNGQGGSACNCDIIP